MQHFSKHQGLLTYIKRKKKKKKVKLIMTLKSDVIMTLTFVLCSDKKRINAGECFIVQNKVANIHFIIPMKLKMT